MARLYHSFDPVTTRPAQSHRLGSVVLSDVTYSRCVAIDNPTDGVGGSSYTTYSRHLAIDNPTDWVGGAFRRDLLPLPGDR